MPKTINVTEHVKRYDETDLTMLSAFIDGLIELKERRTKEEIEKHEAALSLLKSGEIPQPEPRAERKPSSRKKKTAEE